MTATVRPESSSDFPAIRQINEESFESDAEGDLVDALRQGGFVTASLVAETTEGIVGHILFSRLRIITNAGTVEAVSLAPMAVLPSHQRRGIGSELVHAGLEVCRQQGHRIVVVLGHPDFYPRFGFSPALAEALANPFGNGNAWMALELVPGALNGVEGRVEYPPPFAAFE